MKIIYDKKADGVYIKLSDLRPDGVVEISEGINVDTTSDNKLVGIEILDASKKLDLQTILSYHIEMDGINLDVA